MLTYEEYAEEKFNQSFSLFPSNYESVTSEQCILASAIIQTLAGVIMRLSQDA